MLERVWAACRPPTLADEEQNRIAQTLFVIQVMLLIGALAAIGAAWAAHETSVVVGLLASIAAIIGLQLLSRHGHLQAAIFSGLLIMVALVNYLLWTGRGIFDTAMMLCPVIIIIASLLVGPRAFGVLVILVIVSFGVIAFAGMDNAPPLNVTWSDLVIVEVIFIIAALSVRFLADDLRHSLIRARDNEQALAASNAQLQREAARLEILVEIDRAILNAQTLDSIALAVLERLRLLVPSRYAALVLFDFPRHRHEAFVIQTDHGVEVFREWRPFEYFEITEPLRQGQPQVVQDIRALPQPTPMENEMLAEGSRSYIDAPLLVQGELIGALSFEAVEVAAYDADRVQMIQQVADHLAIAVSAARLFEATRQQLDNLRVLQAISVVATDASDEFDLISRVTQIIGLTTTPYSFGVLLLDEAAQVLHVHPSYYVKGPEASPQPIPVDTGIVGWVARHGQLRYAADVDQAPDYICGNAATRSELAVPLKVGRRVIGVLNAESLQREAFTPDDERLLSTIASQLATAILRLRTTAEREALIRDLEAKNAELERFTYTVSHDLKSPLITIRGFLGFVERDARAGNFARLDTDLARIVDATDKMRRLLDELLELSRIGRLMNSPEAVPFDKIVQEAIRLVQGRIEARGVQISVAPDLPLVYGDRTRLVEVMQNLIDNACKFMGEQIAPHITIGQQGHAPDGQPIFFVRDNGQGIDAIYHSKVFGLFDKLDGHSEGTGVGLTLVKRIVEVHGGTIWIESAGLNQGSTFYFSLPIPL